MGNGRHTNWSHWVKPDIWVEPVYSLDDKQKEIFSRIKFVNRFNPRKKINVYFDGKFIGFIVNPMCDHNTWLYPLGDKSRKCFLGAPDDSNNTGAAFKMLRLNGFEIDAPKILSGGFWKIAY